MSTLRQFIAGVLLVSLKFRGSEFLGRWLSDGRLADGVVSSKHCLPAVLRVSAAAQAGAATGSGRYAGTMSLAKSSAAPFRIFSIQTIGNSKGEA